MIINLHKDMSPQTAAIYQLLLKPEPMTAAKIGKALQIYPHGVYRAMETLEEMGLIKKSEDYPVVYYAKPLEDALSFYLNNARERFLQSFFSAGDNMQVSSTIAASTGLQIGFVKNRQDMLSQSDEDMRRAKNDVVMIVSGLVSSNETILAYKRAMERGVRIRVIVQRLDESNGETIRNWKRMGLEVRYYPLIEARILLFDSQIAYIVSYDPKEKEEGVGVRFNYGPITLLMEELFEKRWNLAEEI